MLRLLLLLRFALCLPVELILPPQRDILRLVIAEAPFQAFLDDPAGAKVEHHDARDHDLEVCGEGHEFKLVVEFGDEFGSAGEGDGGDGHEAPVHALVFADGFAEGTALVVDCEGGDLLDELEEVDG